MDKTPVLLKRLLNGTAEKIAYLSAFFHSAQSENLAGC